MKPTPLRRIALVGSAVLAYSGATALARRVRRRRGDHRVYILTYHEIGRGPHEPEGTVSARRFRSHLEYVKSRFDVVSLADAVSMLSQRSPLRRDCVAITFDDGYVGNHRHALPLLSEQRLPATVFVTTGFLDGRPLWFAAARGAFARLATGADALSPALRATLVQAFGGWPIDDDRDAVESMKRMRGEMRETVVAALLANAPGGSTPTQPLTWDDVRSLARGGIEIGSHTVTHPILSTIGADAQRSEIADSRRRIAEEVGREPRFFAYPNGGTSDFDLDTVRILKECGFEAACSTVQGPNVPGCDVFRLQRIGVGADPWHLLEARFSGLLDQHVRRRILAAPTAEPAALH